MSQGILTMGSLEAGEAKSMQTTERQAGGRGSEGEIAGRVRADRSDRAGYWCEWKLAGPGQREAGLELWRQQAT